MAGFRTPDDEAEDGTEDFYQEINSRGEANGDARTRIPPEVVPESPQGVPWYEALFPKSSANADAPAYSPRALDAAWRDISSAPGRAYASLTRPEGESYLDAMARTEAPEGAEGAWGVTDNLLRDPLLAPSLAAPALRIPAWLAAAAPRWVRAAAAGVELGANVGSRPMQAARAAAKATPGGAAIAGLSQSERLARGEAPNVGQALGTFAAAPVLAGTGPLVEGAGAGMKNLAGKYLTTVIKPTDKARAAGWDPTQLMGELANESRFGYVPMTLGGMRDAAQDAITSRAALRPAAIAADEAEALAAGITPRVNLRRAYGMGVRDLEQGLADQSLTGAVQSVPSAEAWLKRNLQVFPAESGPALLTDYTPIENALNARRGIDAFAYVPNAKGVSAAREIAAKGARREINRQLDRFAPRTRAVDASLAPLMANAEGLGIVGERRMNNALINPMDIATGFVGGSATGSAANGTLLALALRALRTPAPASVGFMAGRAAQATGRGLQARPSLGSMLMQSQTDNAR